MKFKDYYAYYLTLHQNKWCRRLHIIGNVTTILFIMMACGIKYWLLLLIAPFIIYPFAWSGHFLFEKNKPAAWTNPLKAKLCDWKMMRGRIEW